jgi:hypothetical protein
LHHAVLRWVSGGCLIVGHQYFLRKKQTRGKDSYGSGYA